MYPHFANKKARKYTGAVTSPSVTQAESGFKHKSLIPEPIILHKFVKHLPSFPTSSGKLSQIGMVGSVGTGVSAVSEASSLSGTAGQSWLGYGS